MNAAGIERLTAALADRYRVEHELGRGGMGAVYRAQDLRHQRAVALKVLHAELASAVGAERFKREIFLAARLQHPNILTVHDSGESAGFLWFTMPLVEGESLRHRLSRDKRLPVDEAVRLGAEVAEALGYAHQQGVVHRDIKPENILLSNGHAVVADFGIARPTGEATGEGLTGTGLIIGTPAYMSPEQAGGAGEVDGRSDVYSLGCVLYEALAGEAPFKGPTPQAILAAALTTVPRRLGGVRPELPDGLEAIVARAMAREPQERYATSAALAAELRSGLATPWRRGLQLRPAAKAGAAVLLLGLATLAGAKLWRARLAGFPGSVPYVAVLPFQNESVSGDAYQVEGLTDQVRGTLAALPAVAVIARASSERYAVIDRPLEQIADELGAQYVVTGKYQRDSAGPAGGQGQVRLEVVHRERAGRAMVVLGTTIPVAAADVMAAPREIATLILHAMGAKLEAAEQQALAKPPTRDSIAWAEYLRGSEGNRYLRPPVSDLPELIGHFKRAVQRDSLFVEGWARLAIAQTVFGDTLARVAVERALHLAPDDPETALAVSNYESNIGGDFVRAQQVASRALRAHPNETRVLIAMSLAEERAGRFDEAVRYLKQAERLDRRSAEIEGRLSMAHLYLRRFDEGLGYARRAAALDSLGLIFHYDVVLACLGRGDVECARRAIHAVPDQVGTMATLAFFSRYQDLAWVLSKPDLQLLTRFSPTAFDDRANWAWAMWIDYDALGDTLRAAAYADTALQESRRQEFYGVPGEWSWLALVHARLGHRDSALAAIRNARAAIARAPDPWVDPGWQHWFARAFVHLREPDSAVAALRQELSVPYNISREWLRIDPAFAPLRGHPGFEALLRGH